MRAEKEPDPGRDVPQTQAAIKRAPAQKTQRTRKPRKAMKRRTRATRTLSPRTPQKQNLTSWQQNRAASEDVFFARSFFL